MLEGLYAVVIRQAAPSLPWLAYSGVLGLAGCVLGIAFFKRVEPYFAESV